MFRPIEMSYLKVCPTHIDNNYHAPVRRGSLKPHRQSLPIAESFVFISARASAGGRPLHSGNTETSACPEQSRDFRTVLTLAYLLFLFLKPPRPLRPTPSSEKIKHLNYSHIKCTDTSYVKLSYLAEGSGEKKEMGKRKFGKYAAIQI